MKISIIIASKNRLKYLLDLLNDIENQLQKVHEVVISDQSDNFIKINQTYSFHLNHFKNFGSGPCCSRNDAADRSFGDVLIFLDDDARIENNFVKEITKPILNGVAKVCSGKICNINEQQNLKKRNKNFWFFRLTLPPSKEVDFCYYTPAGCTAITKDLFYLIGKYDTFFDPNGAGEDREFAIRLVKLGYNIYFNPNAKLLHIGASHGGRRNINTVSLEFSKNVGYTIFKYFGIYKLFQFRLYLIKRRLIKIVFFELPMHNFQMIFKELEFTNPLLYKNFKS